MNCVSKKAERTGMEGGKEIRKGGKVEGRKE